MFVSLTGVNLLIRLPNRLTGVESCTLLALNDLVVVNLIARPGTDGAFAGNSSQSIGVEEGAAAEEDLSSQRLLYRVSDFSRVLDDCYAGCFEGLHLLSRRTFSA